VHNLSSVVLTPDQPLLLSFGLKFIPPCNFNKNVERNLQTSFTNYMRSVRLRKQFAHAESTKNSFLRVPNPDFVPHRASLVIENYFSVAKRRLQKRIKCYKYLATSTNPTVRWIADTVSSIRALKGIIIKPSDKGYETVIHDLVWYKTECLRQLSDTTTYQIATPHYPLVWAQLRLILRHHGKLFQSEKRILTYLARYLLQLENKQDLRLARFYCITKLHKIPIVGRPIVSSINTATYYASRYLDHELQCFLHRIPAFLQSSQHLLTIVEQTPLPPDCVLVAADITSLYPNIPIAEGLTALRAQLLKWGLSAEHTNFLVHLAHWVLTNNYMEFNSNTYQQISGTAMGTPFAVVFANIFLAYLESKLDLATAPLLFGRYVDDLIAACTSVDTAAAFVTAYNSQYPTIKLTSTIGDSVNFMDLTLSKGTRFRERGILDVQLYSSPTHKFLYLPPWSFHPAKIFTAFISAERRRIRLNCSNDVAYRAHDETFRQRLLARGYTAAFLGPVFERLIPRDHLLAAAANSVRRCKERSVRNHEADDNVPLIFKTPYSPFSRDVNIRHCLKPTRAALDDPDAELIFTKRSPVMCNTRNQNLGDILCSSLLR